MAEDRKALRAARKAEKARIKEEKYYLASQWQLMARKLKKHQLARISLVILGFLYVVALFGNFLDNGPVLMRCRVFPASQLLHGNIVMIHLAQRGYTIQTYNAFHFRPSVSSPPQMR